MRHVAVDLSCRIRGVLCCVISVALELVSGASGSPFLVFLMLEAWHSDCLGCFADFFEVYCLLEVLLSTFTVVVSEFVLGSCVCFSCCML